MTNALLCLILDNIMFRDTNIYIWVGDFNV